MATEFKSFLKRLAHESGEVIKPYFGDTSVAIERKGDESPVTIADRKAEETLRELINKEFPDHGIIGEEFGNENEDAEYVWVLDPIDGTISFTTGCPLFGTLIGLMHKGQPILGAIHQPIVGQLCIGDNETTTLNERPVRIRETASLAEATQLCSCIKTVSEYQPEREANFHELVKQVRVFRTWGDCYGYLLLASGFADIMIDPIMNPWDLQPVIPVVRGAGGVITSWTGEEPKDSAVAAPASLHAEILKVLNPGN